MTQSVCNKASEIYRVCSNKYSGGCYAINLSESEAEPKCKVLNWARSNVNNKNKKYK